MWLGLVLMLAMQAPSIQTIVTDMMSQVDSPRQVVARTPAEWTT